MTGPASGRGEQEDGGQTARLLGQLEGPVLRVGDPGGLVERQRRGRNEPYGAAQRPADIRARTPSEPEHMVGVDGGRQAREPEWRSRVGVRGPRSPGWPMAASSLL